MVTFYSFYLARGRHTVGLPRNALRPGGKYHESLEEPSGVKEGETTSDRRFTYETVRCLGACGLGPVVVVDDDVHGRVKPAKVKDILGPYV